jgi:hypothetical protein
MTNGYRDDLLLDVEEHEGEVESKFDENDEISEIIEETKKEIQAIFENAFENAA